MRVITVYHKSDLVPIFDTKSRFIPDSASKKSDATHKGIIRNYTPKKTAYKTSKSISKKDAFIKNYKKKIDYFVDDLAYENVSKLKKNTTGIPQLLSKAKTFLEIIINNTEPQN